MIPKTGCEANRKITKIFHIFSTLIWQWFLLVLIRTCPCIFSYTPNHCCPEWWTKYMLQFFTREWCWYAVSCILDHGYGYSSRNASCLQLGICHWQWKRCCSEGIFLLWLFQLGCSELQNSLVNSLLLLAWCDVFWLCLVWCHTQFSHMWLFCCGWHFTLWYEKHSVGAFYSPDTLGNFPLFIGEIYLTVEFFISCYGVSILLRRPSYRVDDGIGFHGCDDIYGQR